MIRRTLALLALSVALPSMALAADDVGSAGSILELEVNSPSADTYLIHHGRMLVGNSKNATEYRWGGNACGSRTLSEHMVNQLARALDGGLKVQPRYQMGQGLLRCVVGFTLIP
jgi:hypothetical protein